MTIALIPAAGGSSRLGQPKQLVTLRGETLVHRAVRLTLEAGCERALVVEGAVPLAAALADLSAVELVRCEAWRSGPGVSLRTGALRLGDVDVLVLLVDQVKVEVEHLRALLTAPGDVAAAHYAGTLGVPARFGAARAHVLRELSDGTGAREWLRTHAALVTPVPLPEAEVDLDTPEQLAALQS